MSALVLLAAFVATADVGEPTLREELLSRVKTDQAARMKMIEAGNPPPAELIKVVKEADDKNRVWLKGVIDKHGWPGKSLVGADAAGGGQRHQARQQQQRHLHCQQLRRQLLASWWARRELVACPWQWYRQLLLWRQWRT